MILDHLSNASSYVGLSSRLALALRLARETDWSSRADGRHDLDGERVFALVQEYTTKPREQGRWEAHRAHIDVQLVLSGVEQMGHAPITSLQTYEPYDASRDIEFFADAPGDFLTVRAGMFAILMPQDGHMPGLTPAGAAHGHVRKVVLKVATT